METAITQIMSHNTKFTFKECYNFFGLTFLVLESLIIVPKVGWHARKGFDANKFSSLVLDRFAELIPHFDGHS